MQEGTASTPEAVQAKLFFKEASPKFRSGRHTAVVKEVFDITPKAPETYLIRFTFDNELVFDFEAGQFISIFAEKEGKKISRPYSIASWPENKDYLELCVKVVEGGFMSNYMHHLAPGTKLQSVAPLGRFIVQEPLQLDTVFVATGTGVAPFVSHLGHIFANNLDDGHDIHLVFGTRYSYELIYHDLFLKWEREHPNFRYYSTISRPETPDWKGRVGYVQKIIQNEIKDFGSKQVLICGLNNMVEDVQKLCTQLGFALVRFEKWD
jgi:NAD(P)H-flavin reductase